MDEEQGVKIGFKEIYLEVQGMSKALTSLENRLDSMNHSISLAPQADERSKANAQAIKSLQEKLDEYIERSERLERQRKTDKQWGIGIILAFIAGIGKLYFK